MNRELLRYSKSSRIFLILTVVLGLAWTVVMIVQLSLLSSIVNAVFMKRQGLSQQVFPLSLLLIMLVVRSALTWLREVSAQESALRAKVALRNYLFAHLMALGPALRSNARTGELLATLSDGIERLDAYISQYLPQTVLSVCIPLLIFIYLLPIDWISALLLMVTAPIIVLMMYMIGTYTEKRTQKQWRALTHMSAHFLDSIQGLPTLKIFWHSEEANKRISRISQRFEHTTMKVLRIAFISGLVLEFMTALAIALIAVALGIRLLNHSIPFADAFLILLLVPEFYRPLRDLGAHRHAAIEGKAAAQRISELLHTTVPTAKTTFTITEHQNKPREQLTLELTNISYTYPQSSRPALHGVTLRMEANTCTALIGSSGSGKSTLVHLLLRFMDSDGGCIAINGIPISELPVEMWREYVALVPQRPYLFDTTIMDNIRLGRPSASAQEVMHAAEQAGASEFIDQLPDGYNTIVGERGSRLSAGQIQRLAIARAFLKDAPLLILDEPTSSLDPISEVLIQQAIARLMQQRTVLVIAHRYNTIKQAKQIAVLAHGELMECGTPQQLLARNGQYARLVQGNETKEAYA
ncbi:thiol reductant ABC exporter subunit CydD [Dictyobacter halimunensis]|uniref:thiol reductant ABC exporter subunit CydD n=1 Tax=Dictyobacter halimunensis TaxID=3026934 RepID=UPI0030C68D0C